MDHFNINRPRCRLFTKRVQPSKDGQVMICCCLPSIITRVLVRQRRLEDSVLNKFHKQSKQVLIFIFQSALAVIHSNNNRTPFFETRLNFAADARWRSKTIIASDVVCASANYLFERYFPSKLSVVTYLASITITFTKNSAKFFAGFIEKALTSFLSWFIVSQQKFPKSFT